MKISADSASKEEILKILLSVKGPTEAEIGCVSCRIFQEVRNENAIFYEEVWQNRNKLNDHIRTGIYRNILAALDMSNEVPDVEFISISRISGMELIKEALGYYDLKEIGQKRFILKGKRLRR